MNNNSIYLWSSFLIVGLVTFILRGSFIVAGKRLSLPDEMKKYLSYAPSAALASIIGPELFMPQGKLVLLSGETLAAFIAMGSVFVFKKNWVPFVIGLICLLAFNA
ncbi:AzlD domain-containing protein [Leeia sp. TBRC 13508]|uniref:AzlD domain-containing protein n=1 Tax=Leeia speluncae TaxID=2884804 RepID=A0ABS8DAA1_9NEIS|nr:AzlD domain-containing protein [Leeia speluncae]MCB6185130.1 AzlD domain-containing protein [Leeia speluncae]